MLNDKHIEQHAGYLIIEKELQCKQQSVNECPPSECQHEADMTTVTALLCNPPIYQFKCIKCGEFYR